MLTYDALGDTPGKVVGTATDMVEVKWSPLDNEDFIFEKITAVGSVGTDAAQNVGFIWFSGLAGATISFEYNINYEYIPELNKDLYGIAPGPLADPAEIGKKVKISDLASVVQR